MVKYEDACFGPCGADCDGHYCSLKDKTVKILSCDKCRREVDTLFEVDGKEVCKDCLINMFDCDEGECDSCGCHEFVYYVEGSWYCEDCIEEQFDVIREDDD